MGAGLYLRRGGGGNGLIFKHISTGRLGLGAGGGRGTLPGLPLPRGAEKQISRGARSANLGGWGGLGPPEKFFKFGP